MISFSSFQSYERFLPQRDITQKSSAHSWDKNRERADLMIYKTFQENTKARQDPVNGDLLVAGRTLRMLTLPTR
jgi:hypothetical protein